MLGKREKRQRFWQSPQALYGDRVPSPGEWRQLRNFPTAAPLLLEVGCGKGEFAVWIARHHPEALIIGMDRRADRLAAGCRYAQQAHLSNVLFYHGDALTLQNTFAPGEVTTIWLNYPDPYPKRRHVKHRLTHPRFLWQYERILSPSGRLHLRTDDQNLFAYSQEQLQRAGWKILHATPALAPEEGPPAAHVETEFRRKKGGAICYIEAEPPYALTEEKLRP